MDTAGIQKVGFSAINIVSVTEAKALKITPKSKLLVERSKPNLQKL